MKHLILIILLAGSPGLFAQQFSLSVETVQTCLPEVPLNATLQGKIVSLEAYGDCLYVSGLSVNVPFGSPSNIHFLVKTCDAFERFELIRLPLFSEQFSSQAALHITNDGDFLLGGRKLYYTKDPVGVWEDISGPNWSSFQRIVTVFSLNTETLFCSVSGWLYRADRLTWDWEQVLDESVVHAFVGPIEKVLAYNTGETICEDPTAPECADLPSHGKLLYSSNSGDTWSILFDDSYALQEILFASENHIIALATQYYDFQRHSFILESADRGNTWSSTLITKQDGLEFSNPAFFSLDIDNAGSRYALNRTQLIRNRSTNETWETILEFDESSAGFIKRFGERLFICRGKEVFVHDLSTTATDPLKTTSEVNLHPNPTTSILKLSFPSSMQGEVSLQLMNTHRQTVFEQAVEDDELLDIGHLLQGVYIAQIKAGDRVLVTKRVVKL